MNIDNSNCCDINYNSYNNYNTSLTRSKGGQTARKLKIHCMVCIINID